MTNFFPLLRQWAKDAKLTNKQLEVYELHLRCAEAMPLPGNYTYGIGAMKLNGKLKSAERQLIRMGIVEKIQSTTQIGMTIYRLKFPKKELVQFEGDHTLEETIEILIGPMDEMSKFQKQMFRNWIEGYGGKIPLMEDTDG